MKIEAGKYYRTRGGQVFGPMVPGGTPASDYVWCLDSLHRGFTWDLEGSWRKGWDGPLDLISEVYVSDTPPSDKPAPETKTLRDEFAMEAMKHLLPKNDWNEGILAMFSYRQADAMMEARKK